MIDNFPVTREHWAAMIDAQLLPDSVLALEDDKAEGNNEAVMLKRLTDSKGLPDLSTWQQKKSDKEVEEDEEEVQ